jgi:diacylglycerol kinase (ATP)
MSQNHSFKRYLFVVNPISGDRDKEDILSEIEIFGYEKKLKIKIFLTSGENDEALLGEEIFSFQPEVIVAVGGDGTVNLVANQIQGSTMALGIIPMGSGNGLSKDLGIPQNDLEKALQLLTNSRIQEIDTLDVNGHFFIHLCDIGFNAHIVKLFNKSGKRGILSYIKFSIREFFRYRNFKFKLETESKTIKGKAFMITVANSNQFGSNITINPEGKLDDGLFEVIIIKRFPRSKIVGIFLRMLTKRINFSPYCVIMKCTRAIITTKRKKTLQYDGEIAENITEVNIKINPKQLKVLVPHSAN